MQLSAFDLGIIGAYFIFMLAIGWAFRSQAGRSLEEFFVSGRSTPWWLAGTSMAATSFAADTPLAVTGMVATGGIAGNWLWWNFALSAMLTAFLYARLWRRCGVLTDVEFAEIRYSGKPAAFLRGFRAVYLAIPINCMVMGWVNLAMVKVLQLTLGVDKVQAIFLVLGLTAFTCLVSALSGLRGVVLTDSVQFVIMIAMAIALAFFAVDGIGGVAELKSRLSSIEGAGSPLSFFPEADSAWMPMLTFFVYLAVSWWAAWYPGAEPGGGGYVAQRMLATRDERHSLMSVLWFNIVHYAVRPWPWIFVALVSLVAYPGLEDPETGYVRVMIDYLPASLRGLMVAGFIAAFMSTISTSLNWGASYLVNDCYRRFLRPDAEEPQLVQMSRYATILLALCSAGVTFYMDSIAGAWKLLLATGAGTGGVLLLRWFWWRINAWSEVAAMTAAAVISLVLQLGVGLDNDDPIDFAWVMLITVAGSTVAWIAVTYLTSPEPEQTLVEFYRRARPYRTLWKPIAKLAPEVQTASGAGRDLLAWAAACISVYAVMFGAGKLLLLEPAAGAMYLVIGLSAGAFVWRTLMEPETVRTRHVVSGDD